MSWSPLPAGSAEVPPFEVGMEKNGLIDDASVSFDASIINAETPTDEANEFLVAQSNGQISIERLEDFSAYSVIGTSPLVTVLAKARIAHIIEGTSNKFDGWFIAEEHPIDPQGKYRYLLLHPERVIPRPAIRRNY